MRIPSGVTDQYVYFVAVDSTDLKTRETGLSSFTVYRSRNGAAAAAMTTPTVNETDSTNMPGVYELLLDEDMTIGSGNDSEEMVFHITATGMAPVTRAIELYRPKITAGNTLDVTATGAAGIDWGNVENATTAVDLSGTDIQLCDTTTSVTNDVGVNEWNGVALSTTNPLPNAAAGAAGGLPTDSTGKTSFNDVSTSQVNAEVSDVLKTDTISEMTQGAPPATPTFEEAVMYVYMAMRNKLDITSTLKEFHNDAGTVIWRKTLSDDGTTYSEAEGVTGP